VISPVSTPLGLNTELTGEDLLERARWLVTYPERWLQMNCPFCSTRMLPGASVCAACGAYLRSEARTLLVFLSVLGYCWFVYEAFTNLRIVGLLFAKLAPSFSTWLGNTHPLLGICVIFGGIIAVPWVLLGIMFKNVPILRKTEWVRRF